MDAFETELMEALRGEARNAPKFRDGMLGAAEPTHSPRAPRAWTLMAASAATGAAALIIPIALSTGEGSDSPRGDEFADGSSTASPSASKSETLAPLDQRVNDTVERLRPYRSRTGFGAILITEDVVTVLWDGPAPTNLQDAAGLQPNGTTIRVATAPLTSAQIDATERSIVELAAQHEVALLSYGPTPERNAVVIELNQAETPPESSSAHAFAASVAKLSVPIRIDYVDGDFVDR